MEAISQGFTDVLDCTALQELSEGYSFEYETHLEDLLNKVPSMASRD